MQIDMPKRRPRGESIIPMINVVFLLLIFFLLTAQIAPADPAAGIPGSGGLHRIGKSSKTLLEAGNRGCWCE